MNGVITFNNVYSLKIYASSSICSFKESCMHLSYSQKFFHRKIPNFESYVLFQHHIIRLFDKKFMLLSLLTVFKEY